MLYSAVGMSTMSNRKLLLIGCGELGSRHLQAVASLPGVKEIHVVDSREQSLELGKTRLKEITDLNPEIEFFWHTRPDTCCAKGHLCIVPTQAQGRCALIKESATTLGYKKFLIEKIVSQSVAEYQDLIEFSARNNLQIWVNCKTRAYGIHQYIKSKLDPRASLIFTRLGGNHGLATNGVHTADLFAFYDGSSRIYGVGARIDEAVHTTKRGQYDLSGALYGRTDKGSDLAILFSASHEGPDIISIVSSRGRFIVDHFQKWAQESLPETNWQWRPVAINEDWMVSAMTKVFVRDILNKERCNLPTLMECFPAHEFILGQLLPHFNRLLNMQKDFCPVT